MMRKKESPKKRTTGQLFRPSPPTEERKGGDTEQHQRPWFWHDLPDEAVFNAADQADANELVGVVDVSGSTCRVCPVFRLTGIGLWHCHSPMTLMTVSLIQ